MATIDIPAGALDVVLRALSRHVPNREIRVMGSRAEGRSKPFSDLDLRALGQLRDAFDDSNLPFAVDIIETIATLAWSVADRIPIIRPWPPTPWADFPACHSAGACAPTRGGGGPPAADQWPQPPPG